MWLGTVLVLAAAAWALRGDLPRSERRGYLVVLWSNAVYVVAAVVHFSQHLNHQEVDWAHVSLAVTNVGSVVGVMMVMASRLKPAPPGRRSSGSGSPRRTNRPLLSRIGLPGNEVEKNHEVDETDDRHD